MAEIEKLTSSNYSTWTKTVRALLMRDGLWQTVSNPVKAKESAEDESSYELLEQKACGIIFLSISPELQPLFEDAATGSELWKGISDYFKPVSRTRKISLLEQFLNERFKDGDNVALFANRLKNIAKELSDSGYVVDNTIKCIQLIRHLPPEFAAYVQAVYRYTDEQFVFEVLVEELKAEESRLQFCNGNNLEYSTFNSVSNANKINTNVKCSKTKFKNKFKTAVCEISPACLNEINNINWYFDTAASKHMINNKDVLLNYKPVNNLKITLAVTGKECNVEGIGDIQYNINTSSGIKLLKLKNVLYSPKLRRNLISGAALEADGFSFTGKNGYINVYNKDNNLLFQCKRINNLYVFKPYSFINANVELNATENDNKLSLIKLWHLRFNHINIDYLKNTCRNNCVRGLPQIKDTKLFCNECQITKNRRISFKPIGKIRSSKPLQLLHLDVGGPLPVTSVNGNRYYLTITDDYSRKVTVYLMRDKTQVFDFFRKYQMRNERFLNSKIINCRTDNGMEFCHKQFHDYLDKEGIHAERTNFYSPEQNGVSEKFNLTALDSVKAMLKSSKLDQKFWDEALLCFVYTWNRTCHKNSKTPIELFSGNSPSVKHLKIFGCLTYVGVPQQLRKKLDPRAKPGIMLGYALKTRGYRIWLKNEQKIIETANAKFFEDKLGVEALLDPVPSTSPKTITFEYKPSNDKPKTRILPCSEAEWERQAILRKDKSRHDIYYSLKNTRSRLRSHKDAEKFCKSHNLRYDKNFFDFSTKNTFSGSVGKILSVDNNNGNQPDISLDEVTCNTEIIIPKNYNQCLKSTNKNQWIQAMDEEIRVMKERKVWTVLPKPKNEPIIGSRWVYNVKTNQNNEIVRFKARLVAKGFSQIKGLSYDEIFSPVVDFSVIRFFFSLLITYFNWTHVQLDIKNAYLYANLKENIYMQQPQGYFEKSDNYVCKLNKAIYGLHQSGREWYQELDKMFLKLNFRKLKWSNCTYIYQNLAIILVYVDDFLIFSKTHAIQNTLVKMISNKFDVTIIGKTTKLLGINFTYESNKLLIHQSDYIIRLYKMYSMYKCKITSLPITKYSLVSKLDSPKTNLEKQQMEKFPYRNLLGSLAFIAQRTRPDISFAVNHLSQYQENPGMRHWVALLKLLNYVYHTHHYKLNLTITNNVDLKCYSDSNFASNVDDRISIGGILVTLDKAPIFWRTFKHKSVTLSTMEAEFVTLTEAVKELLWYKRIITECLNLNLFKIQNFTDNVYCDNQAAISFSKSNIENKRTKHIDIKYHFIRNLIDNDEIKIQYLPSDYNLADVLTKPLTRKGLNDFVMTFFFFKCKSHDIE